MIHLQLPPLSGLPSHTSTTYLRVLLRRILKDLNITVRFRPHQTLRNILVSAKDHALPETRTGVVYSIPVVTVQQHMLAKLKDLSHIV